MPIPGAPPPGAPPIQGAPQGVPHPMASPAAAITQKEGFHQKGLQMMEGAAKLLSLAVPLLSGAQEQEAAAKMLQIAIKALPAAQSAIAPPQAGSLPHPM